jgi:hypothetical protein
MKNWLAIVNLVVLSIILLLSTFQQATAQISWQPLPLKFDGAIRNFYVDSTDTTLYINGNFTYVNENYTGSFIKVKKDFSLVPMPVLPGVSFGIVKWRGNLYTGCCFSKFDGTTWQYLDCNGATYCIFPYKDKLLLGGNYADGFGGDTSLRSCIIEYDGTTIRNFQGIDSVIENSWFVDAMVEYRGELIVGGNFDPYPPRDRRYKEIIKWTGTNWAPLDDGIQGGGLDNVTCLRVVNNDLYVAGYFRKDLGAPGNSIARWNGRSWDDMGGGVDIGIFDVFNRGDTLLIAGNFDFANGRYSSNYAAYVNGKWCANSTPIDNGTSVSIDFFGDLIVGGGFWNIGADSCVKIAKITSLSGPFYSLATEDSKLKEADISISPNPGDGLFKVNVTAQHNLRAVTFAVTNILGQRIWNSSFTCNENQISREIDLCGVPKGMYLLQANIDGEVFSKKLLMK